MTTGGRTIEDVTGATGRQILDDIFEESRMRRVALESDVDPDALAELALPCDPYVALYRGIIAIGTERHHDGETLVVASNAQERRYLLKRWNNRATFKVYQLTPVEGEKLRLLNVYRAMLGQSVSVPEVG